MIHLLRDDLFGEERLAAIRASLGPPDVQSLNTTILDGQRLSVADLRAAAEAMPFLGERRLVVVRRLFSGNSSGSNRADASAEGGSTRRGGRSDNDRERDLLAYLPMIPESTDLVIVEDADFSAAHALTKHVVNLGGEVSIVAMPRWDELGEWIAQRVRAKGGRIDRAAVQELAAQPVGDLRQLDLTLDSLITYADGRNIGVDAVRALVPRSHDVKVFDLVDAVGARDRKGALSAYRLLLADNASPIYILVMLARQVRLLLLANEALDRHENLATALKVHPRVAHKLAQQVRSFGSERCLAAIQRLAEVDQSIKTGEAAEELALELLIVELTER